jgi:hypothetical protein
MTEMMNPMQELIAFVKENPNFTISDALVTLTQSYQQQAGAPQGQANVASGQQMPQGNRMMSGPNFMAMSPAMQNNLIQGGVGSPHMSSGTLGHTPSPGQAHMAPPMMTQHSQQGNAAASTNTSPAAGKRRRSTAPIKDEDNVNGTKVKQSPRMGNNSKRAKQT